jgi:hypothetical protein
VRASSQKVRDKTLIGAFALARAATSARILSDEDIVRIIEHALAELSETDHLLITAELRAHHQALTTPIAELCLLDQTYPATISDLAELYRGRICKFFPDEFKAPKHRPLIIDAIASSMLATIQLN